MKRRPWELYLTLAGLGLLPGLAVLEELRVKVDLGPTAGRVVVFSSLGVGAVGGFIGIFRLDGWRAGLSVLSALACSGLLLFGGFLYLLGPMNLGP